MRGAGARGDKRRRDLTQRAVRIAPRGPMRLRRHRTTRCHVMIALVVPGDYGDAHTPARRRHARREDSERIRETVARW
jgi:hypothetical protein